MTGSVRVQQFALIVESLPADPERRLADDVEQYGHNLGESPAVADLARIACLIRRAAEIQKAQQ